MIWLNQEPIPTWLAKKYIGQLTQNQGKPQQTQLQSAEITHTVSALTTEELALDMVALPPG